MAKCDSREEKIPAKYGNDVEGRCLVHVPKTLKGTKGNVAFIEIHGGAAMAGSPELQFGPACYMAINNNAIVFNPKYRLAQEKGPTAH